MLVAILTPLLLQGVVMLVDEFYFHHQRGLGRWERLGHPVDTASVLLCVGLLLGLKPENFSLGLYVFFSAISCLLITKDEWVHSELCRPFENWLHSLLFVLHPICLGVLGWIWWQGIYFEVLRTQAGVLVAFMAYQIFYWNFYGKNGSQIPGK